MKLTIDWKEKILEHLQPDEQRWTMCHSWHHGSHNWNNVISYVITISLTFKCMKEQAVL